MQANQLNDRPKTKAEVPNWEKGYTQIWTEFRDDPRYSQLAEQELRRIHIKWRRLAAEA